MKIEFTSTSLLACSVNTRAHSSTSFSSPECAASINTSNGTLVSRKLHILLKNKEYITIIKLNKYLLCFFIFLFYLSDT